MALGGKPCSATGYCGTGGGFGNTIGGTGGRFCSATGCGGTRRVGFAVCLVTVAHGGVTVQVIIVALGARFYSMVGYSGTGGGVGFAVRLVALGGGFCSITS